MSVARRWAERSDSGSGPRDRVRIIEGVAWGGAVAEVGVEEMVVAEVEVEVEEEMEEVEVDVKEGVARGGAVAAGWLSRAPQRTQAAQPPASDRPALALARTLRRSPRNL